MLELYSYTQIRIGVSYMDKEMNLLEEKIIKLKLEKRDLVLAGKDTNEIDQKINSVKIEMDKLELVIK